MAQFLFVRLKFDLRLPVMNTLLPNEARGKLDFLNPGADFQTWTKSGRISLNTSLSLIGQFQIKIHQHESPILQIADDLSDIFVGVLGEVVKD